MRTTATLGDPVRVQPAGAGDTTGSGVINIPLHRLKGEAGYCADRLVRVFSAATLDGVEWSLKFTPSGIVGDRFLLALKREHWHVIDGAALLAALRMPQSLWEAMQEDLQLAETAYFSYEPDDGAGQYRVYLEMLPAPEVLRAAGSVRLGCGYKWDPASGRTVAVTRYRMHHLADAAAFEGYLQPYFARLTQPALRETARSLVAAASAQADPSDFMLLEAAESGSPRDSFAVTFRGVHLPLARFTADLLRLATALALPAQQVLDCLVPDEPRQLSSVAAGVTRGGEDFLTVYYV